MDLEFDAFAHSHIRTFAHVLHFNPQILHFIQLHLDNSLHMADLYVINQKRI